MGARNVVGCSTPLLTTTLGRVSAPSRNDPGSGSLRLRAPAQASRAGFGLFGEDAVDK